MSGIRREGGKKAVSGGTPGGVAWGPDGQTREQAALFLLEREPMLCACLRRRLRGKVQSADLEDLLASVRRRMDLAVRKGAFRGRCAGEFWNYACKAAENLALERLRDARRERAAAEGWLARRAGLSADDATRPLSEILPLLDSDEDRELLLLKARGASYAQIAAATGRGEPSLRKRWERVARVLPSRTDPAA